MDWEGCFTPLVTPFDEEGGIDHPALHKLLARQVEAKTAGVVILGTTGETPTLSEQEQQGIIEESVAQVGHRIKVIVGTGSYDTATAVRKTKAAKRAGADACLIVFPYYNRPSAEGVRKHFAEIAKVELPIILYNHPARTGLKLSAKDISEIMDIPEVVAIKDASGDLDLWVQLIERSGKPVLAGDDLHILPLIALGGRGAISIISNLFPEKWSQMVKYCLEGEFRAARTIFYPFVPLCRALLLETNPQCVKYALHCLGLCNPRMRLPLIEPAESTQAEIQKELSSIVTDHLFLSSIDRTLLQSI